ncbi:P-loop containing nucleoside triphosphate hydrolase [Pseudocohnilembus persalinus]|uniref:p-loop containing nucleoside triphosphate hydrolase n=1 Tax=Pseudocohnilembus persalinus TaxID=266149 RepID=A0A0V0Q801_PSEPJ|nr:P-loop containing nucleoside triphosphate hydrolase [Pseudocohnilembus persalinus]|eukprot:KRW98293.1 P-loop containing nucleoside triphosphate hydrolase [Pseudocohnilembus persalinus]
MSKWLKEIQNNNIDKGIQIMVIGNKLDLIEDKTHRRAVDLQQVNQFIQENKLLYAETSAKTGQNVKESFEKIYDEGVKQGNNPQMGHGSYPLNNEPIQTGDSCCSYCQPKV